MFRANSIWIVALAFFGPLSVFGHGMLGGELRLTEHDGSHIKTNGVPKNSAILHSVLSDWITRSLLHKRMNDVGDADENNNYKRQNQRNSPQRFLQDTTQIPCGSVLQSWTKEETITNAKDILTASGAVEASQVDTLVTALQTLIKSGVRIQKICGSCQDFPSIGGPCASGNYGANVTQSGVMTVPIDQDSEQIVSGNHPAVLYMHPSRTNGSYQDWMNYVELQVDVLFNALGTAMSGSVNVLPDYMGYGESLNVTCKSYLIRQGYGIAAIPLVEVAKQIVKTETNCNASVANAVAVLGYSEGGYAALAVADALNSLGYKIIHLQMGAAPMRLSSLQVGLTIQGLQQNTISPDEYYIAVLFGLAYSSTCLSLANYGTGQDLMDGQYRDLFLNLSNRDASYLVLNDNFPAQDPISVVNGIVRNATLPLVESGNLAVCAASSVVDGATDKLCQALREQDLDAVFLNVTYPTTYCYSVDDATVSPKHIPEGASENPNIEFVNTTGTHLEAGAFCLFRDLYYLVGQEFASFQISADMVDSCEASPAPSPNNNDGGSSSGYALIVSSWSMAALALICLFAIMV